jgi:hypothetical protein
MAFRAMTNSAALAIGVHLHMVETDAPASFPIIIDPGTLFAIGFHPFTGRELAAQVVQVVGQHVGFSVEDGSSWEMSPLVHGQDLGPTVQSSAGVRCSDWVIRREVDAF